MVQTIRCEWLSFPPHPLKKHFVFRLLISQNQSKKIVHDDKKLFLGIIFKNLFFILWQLPNSFPNIKKSNDMSTFFGFYKETNHIYICSVGFDKTAIFLRGRDFSVKKLYGFKKDEEVDLLRKDEEPSWTTKDHYIDIGWLLDEDDSTPITYAEIDLENGGSIYFSVGELAVSYPSGEDIKEKTIRLLETMGYYAGREIIEFCELNPDRHMLDFVLGREPKDITDEFQRMKEYTDSLNKQDY